MSDLPRDINAIAPWPADPAAYFNYEFGYDGLGRRVWTQGAFRHAILARWLLNFVMCLSITAITLNTGCYSGASKSNTQSAFQKPHFVQSDYPKLGYSLFVDLIVLQATASECHAARMAIAGAPVQAIPSLIWFWPVDASGDLIRITGNQPYLPFTDANYASPDLSKTSGKSFGSTSYPLNAISAKQHSYTSEECEIRAVAMAVLSPLHQWCKIHNNSVPKDYASVLSLLSLHPLESQVGELKAEYRLSQVWIKTGTTGATERFAIEVVYNSRTYLCTLDVSAPQSTMASVYTIQPLTPEDSSLLSGFGPWGNL